VGNAHRLACWWAVPTLRRLRNLGLLCAILAITASVALAGKPPVAPDRPQHDRPTDYTLNPIVHPDELNAGPRKIISIAPSITETCAALGLADRIVGRTQYCTHPPTVQHADVIGAYADTNLEKILALKPDLVLITDSSPKLEENLKKLKLPYATVPDSTLDDVFAAIQQLGDLLGRPRTAQALADRLRTDLDRLSERAGKHSATKVLFTFTPLPQRAESIYVAGPGGYLDTLLGMAGYSNALADRLAKPWARISLETIISARPDFILEVRPPDKAVDADQLYRGWSALAGVPAISKRQIRSLTSTAIAKPGPRINIALHEIITALSQ
jgi:iron complex transport system substrate-binding protein